MLIDTVNVFREKSKVFIQVNEKTVDDTFETTREGVQSFIADTRPLPRQKNERVTAEDLLRNNPVRWLSDNPMVKTLMKMNPIKILIEASTEAFQEETQIDLSKDIKFPSFQPLSSILTEILPDLIASQIENFLRLIKDVWQKMQKVLNNPETLWDQSKALLQDMVWTVFDGIKELVLAIWKSLGACVDQAFEFMTGTFKIPKLTTWYEFYTGQVSVWFCPRLTERH